ncbi:MAG: nucleotidyltransferase domain-containing protein [archaeon]|nr:nucleotidyltransferase domain-containing protein [archaeon]
MEENDFQFNFLKKKKKAEISKNNFEQSNRKNIKVNRKNTSESENYLLKSKNASKEIKYYNISDEDDKEEGEIIDLTKEDKEIPQFSSIDNILKEEDEEEDKISRNEKLKKDFMMFDINKPKYNLKDKKINLQDYPWLNEDSECLKENGQLKLHFELIQFWNFIKPTEKENSIKYEDFDYIKKLIKTLHPNAEIKLVGSIKSNLNLPNGDIDIVVIIPPNSEKKLSLEEISKLFLKENTFEYVEVIKASVPIIKCTLSKSKTNIDISFNRTNAIEANKLINKILNTCPYMTPLIYFLKYFLKQKRLNEIYLGGINSFILFNMLYAYILYLRKKEDFNKDEINLGSILIGFLNFYGFEFKYDVLGISVRKGGFFYDRTKSIFKSHSRRKEILCLENPQEPFTNLGAKSYKYAAIINSFRTARDALVYPQRPNYISALGLILTKDTYLEERRKRFNELNDD